ncbi:MAG: 50S ribosomal protein L24 [Candidatus Aenigmatarchaeota archaeon]
MKTKNPKKQRKQIYNRPHHMSHKDLSVNLSEELRDEFETRNISLREGDEVKVMRGDFKGKSGEVREIDRKGRKVKIDGVEREKTDGTEVHVPISPSNLMIIDPDMSDRMRRKVIERVGGEIEEEMMEEREEEEEEKEEDKETEKGFKCEICGDVFDSKRGLSIHKSRKHKDYMKGD